MISARNAMGLYVILAGVSRGSWHSLRIVCPELFCHGMTALFVLKASLHEYEQTLSL